MSAQELEKIHRVVKELEALRDDELFQMDLKDKECKTAIEYWTTQPEQRNLDYVAAESRFNDNYRVQNVFSKLKRLQYACREVPMGVPIQAVLAGVTDPLYGVRKEGEGKEQKNDGSQNSKPSPKERPSSFVSGKQPPEIYVKDSEHKSVPEENDVYRLSLRNVAVWWSIQIALISIGFKLYQDGVF